MIFHYLLYFEAGEFTSDYHDSPEEIIICSITKNFLNASLYKFRNNKILNKLKEELIDIIQDINIIKFFKIELHIQLNGNLYGFEFIAVHFTSTIELYSRASGEFFPKDELKNILNKIIFRIQKINEIKHTTRFLVNTYIAPRMREAFGNYMKTEIENRKNADSLFFNFSSFLHSYTKFPKKFPFIFELKHNFFCNFDELLTNLLKNFITDELSITHGDWELNLLDFGIKGIKIFFNEKIDFQIVSDMLSDKLVQFIDDIYFMISSYLRDYQKKLMDLDQILPDLNSSEFIANLKSFKSLSFSEHPLLYLQEIDRILLHTDKQSVERLDPPISEIFKNPPYGDNRYDKIQRNYTSLKEELNGAITALQIIISQNHKKLIDDKESTEENAPVGFKKPIEEDEFNIAFNSALNYLGYQYLKPLDKSGSWADLYLVFSRDNTEIRLAKVYSKAFGLINKEIFESDANKLKKIDHENVVKVFNKGHFKIKDTPYFFLVMEYIKGQDFSEINSQIFFEEPYITRLKYFDQALDGINEFRKFFKLHHDLFGRNIMITDPDKNNERKIVIIDPGYSRYSYDPEDEDHDLYSIKEELFSLFLKPEEKSTIIDRVALNELEFPEIRDMIKNLIREEIKQKEKELEDNESKVKQTKEGSLEYIIEILRTSHPKDWSYDDSYGIFTYNINVELNIRIREEIPENGEPFEEDWTNVFVNPSAYKLIAKVYYRGSFVKDYLLVYVDGYRNILPVPKTATDLRISNFSYNLGRILNCRFTPNLDYNLKEFDIKLKMARIELDQDLE